MISSVKNLLAKEISERAYKISNGKIPEHGENCEFRKWREETTDM